MNIGNIPKIKAVENIVDTRLLITFDNGVERIYDCGLLLSRPQFHLLARPAFFNAVRVDPGGYGISWSDNIDLSEYELWTNGKTASNKSPNTDVAKSRHAAEISR